MRSRDVERKQRISLMLLFSGIVLIFLLVTTIIVGLVVFFLVSRGTLQFGKNELNGVSVIFILVLLSAIIGTALAFGTLRFPLKPVNKILNALKRLSSGDYSVRLHFRGIFAKHPTVAELTDSFNKMASELEQTEMLRSDFINNFSHEFKTPIVSITGFAKLLKRGNLSDERRAECLDIIEEESIRLSRMATNVLNMTKVENQTILTDVSSFNLTEQIRTCVLMLEGKWSKKQIDLILPDEEYYISGNEELMMQVWLNLLDNAIKFSPDGEEVNFSIEEKNKFIEVSVSNKGKRIPEESVEKIFNKFYQADESHATEGNGIGLAVVKKIVDLHGGKVSVTSSEELTKFIVVLPKNKSTKR